MLTLRKVSKIRIITVEERKKELIDALYAFGHIQVVTAKDAEYDRPMDSYDRLSEALVDARSIAKRCGLEGDYGEPEGDYKDAVAEFSAFRRGLEPLELQVAKASEKLAEALQVSRLIEEYGVVSWEMFQGQSHACVMFILPHNRKSIGKVLELLEAAKCTLMQPKPGSMGDAPLLLDRTTPKYELMESTNAEPEMKPMVFVTSGEKAKKLEEMLGSHARILAKMNVHNGHVEKAVNDHSKAVEKARGELEDAESEFVAGVTRDKAEFTEILSKLEVLAKLCTLPLKFGKTKNLVIVEGWIPDNRISTLRKIVEKSTDRIALVEVLETPDLPPSMQDNPSFAKPFERLVSFFSMPQNGELDPTLLIAITFPLFFGLIMGDVGYGIIALLLSLWLGHKFRRGFISDISKVLMLSSISTILFGFVFGEAFGSEELLGMHLHPLIPRMEAQGTAALAAISIGLGIVQLLSGYIIGLVNALHHRDNRHAAAKLSWITLLLGITLMALAKTATGGAVMGIAAHIVETAAEAAMLLGAIGIVATEGMGGGIEIIGLFSNLLSYLRIMALGLSGAILGMVVSRIPVDFGALVAMLTGAQPFSVGALLTFIAFATILAIGHAVAVGLGLMEAGIQSLRLHYVEFFSKFYHGGGVPFTPLREGKAAANYDYKEE